MAADGSADPEYSGAPYVRAEESAKPLSFRVPVEKTSLIGFAGDRVQSAVYDKTEIDLRTDSRQGQVFVRVLTDVPASLYLSTESGATVPVTLIPDPKAQPQTIVLRRAQGAASFGTDSRSAAALAPMPASDHEAALKRFVRHAALGEESADIMKRAACPPPSASFKTALERLAPLNPKVESCWSSLSFKGAAVRIKNSRLAEMKLALPALAGPTVLAVAAEKTDLTFGASTTVYFVEASDGR